MPQTVGVHIGILEGLSYEDPEKQQEGRLPHHHHHHRDDRSHPAQHCTATLLVLSVSEIIQFVSGLTGADASLSLDLLKLSGVLLWIAAFLFLYLLEVVLGFIGWMFWSMITGF